MKNLVFILSIFLCCWVKAQGNLQFNQVLNLSFSNNNTPYTVPAGKVWKIENVSLSSFSSYFFMNINGQQIFLKNTHTGYGPEFSSFPYWVSGGQNISFGGLTSGVVSIIEFNIIP